MLSRYVIKVGEYDGIKVVDHDDRNKLNNCKRNLFIKTKRENSLNVTKNKKCTSKYYGVYYC